MQRVVGQSASVILIGCFAIGCAESFEQRARRLEPMLTQAGFRMVPANTPTRLQKLAGIIPLRMSYLSRDGNSSYSFADPYVCYCIYVENQLEYQRFEVLKGQEQAEKSSQQAQAADQEGNEEFMSSPPNQIFYGQ